MLFRLTLLLGVSLCYLQRGMGNRAAWQQGVPEAEEDALDAAAATWEFMWAYLPCRTSHVSHVQIPPEVGERRRKGPLHQPPSPWSDARGRIRGSSSSAHLFKPI